MDSAKTGALIAELRKKKGLTQIQLADLLSISNRTVSKWEKGDGFPDITLIPKIAELLGVTADELLAGEQNKADETETQPEFICEFDESVKDWAATLRLYRNKKSPVWFEVLVFLSVCILLYVVGMLNLIGSKAIIICFVIFVGFIVLYATMPIISAQYQMSRTKQLAGGENRATDYFTLDVLTIIQGNNKQEFKLADVTALYETKRLCILIINKKVITYIPKDSFVKGNFDDFSHFIKSRFNERSNKINLLRVFQIILSVLLVMLMCILLPLASYYKTEFLYSNYISMSVEELTALDDNNLYYAVSDRLWYEIDYDNYAYSVNSFNQYKRTFFIVDEFYTEYLNGGVCQYLCNSDGLFLDELTSSLNEVGLSDVAAEYDDFIKQNNIDVSKYSEDVSYDEEVEKYPFDDIDEKLDEFYESNEFQSALSKYARENIEYFN
ncbi:MAG: helix-turn-helix domain-containing protein [Clostridiales bacterium]|nr:helix-turn-helix domain-containing protein [Clostridiales bacterium]